MQEFFYYFWIGAAGAASLEALKLWELRGKLDQVRYVNLRRSPRFWALVAGMFLASGFLAWAFCAGRDPWATPWQVVLAAVGCRSFIRCGIETSVANSRTKLGGDGSADLRDAFR